MEDPRSRRTSLVAALVLAIAPGAPGPPAAAQEDPISVEVSSAVVRRQDAPFPLEISVAYRGGGVLSGRLELRFQDERGRAVGAIRTGKISLASARQSYRVLVPPLEEHAPRGQVDIALRFIAADREFDLGKRPLFSTPVVEEEHLVAVCFAPDAPPSYDRLVRAMRLERFHPGGAWSATFPIPLRSRAIPSRPLHYCAYDLVVVESRVLVAMSPEQREALSVWVKGGGRLLLVAPGVFHGRAVDFVARLVASGRPRALLTEGPLPPPAGEPRAFAVGLGRLVVSEEIPGEEALEAPAWRAAHLFLWDLDLNRWDRARVIEGGELGARPRSWFRIGRATSPASPGLADGRTERALLNLLLPEEIEVMPLAVVCLLFGGFLLAVGPLDYLILGWLRRRSYTWLLFPVLSVGFALLTLHLSSRYLGSSEVRGALVVVDVGRGGEVLRSSRYEALFPRRDERTSVAGKDEVFTLCTARFRDGRALSGRGRRAEPLLYEGRFPEAYRVTRSLRQWSPVLQRRFRLGPDPRIRVPAVDWDALESLDPSESGFEERARDLLRPDLPAGPAVWLRCDESMPYVIQAGSAVLPLRSLWPALRVRGVPARISPSGSGFRDLAVSRGLTTWDVALLVIERSETEIIFYRRLYEAAP